jgi:hypothetical protein
MNAKSHQPWVNADIFEDIRDGRNFETLLQDLGIQARTYNDKWLQLVLFLCPPRAAYRVQVRQGHFEGAMRMIKDVHPPVLGKAMHCPAYGSLHVNYPQMTRKFLLPTILLHLAIIFRIIDHECYCESCHITWNLSPKASRKNHITRQAFPFKK